MTTNIIICFGRIKRWCNTYLPGGKIWIQFRWILWQKRLINWCKQHWNICQKFRKYLEKYIDEINKIENGDNFLNEDELNEILE